MRPYLLCMRTIINKDDTHVTLSIKIMHKRRTYVACSLTLGDVAFLAFSNSLAISSLCVIAEQGLQVSMWTLDEATTKNSCTNI
jgi:hypothetical protein